jgi:hypothetical protein
MNTLQNHLTIMGLLIQVIMIKMEGRKCGVNLEMWVMVSQKKCSTAAFSVNERTCPEGTGQAPSEL